MAHVRSDGGRNLRFCRSVDKEAVMAAHVHEHDLEVKNLRRRVGDFRRQLRRLARLWVTGFLGFGRERSWNMSVALVSSGNAWIYADLIS